MKLELIRLVKHMERMRNDCYTTLRDAEYKIDKEVKEYHHFDEMRRCYKSDLKHATQTVERMKMEELLERRGGTPPLYSPSYIRWLDSQSLDEDSSPKPSKSKSRSKSLSKDGRSSSKSPGRSKSRSKSKRRDETEDPTTDQGADDGGTDQGGDDDDKKGASGGESGKDGDKK
ncbi:hypothetical protein Ocin01_02495 [Orchesella cincta]|uniref:Uncharacterized protein n=1 Tax=Orchesella cincta TaxID=48709 RepID=A0A1D2NFX9_ORCCI|nr:hypothetical protein Ocin01_02495 [Orchesella cincta]